MWRISGEALTQLGQSHTSVARVDVLHGGRPVATLIPGPDCQVDTDSSATILRRFRGTIADPTGTLSPSDARDLLSPFVAELAPYRGVRLSDGTVELVPQGVYRIPQSTVRQVDGLVTVEFVGYDRAYACEGPLPGPVGIPAGTPVEDAIGMLLAGKQPTAGYRPMVTGFTSPALLVDTTDVWAEARRLARAAGAVLQFDRQGIAELAPYTLTASPTLRTRYAEGDGAVFWAPQRDLDVDGFANVVVVEGSNTAVGPVRGQAADLDPASPTYVGGPAGVRVLSTRSEVVTSTVQANQMAAAILAEHLGVSESVSFTAVPHPALDAGDTVAVTAASMGLADRLLLVDRISLPLAATGEMTVRTRKTVLTGDGYVTPAGVGT